MWRYIYFSLYLDTIDISDHNAIQKFVHDMVLAIMPSNRLLVCVCTCMFMINSPLQISEGKIGFFPLFQALALEEEVDETRKQLDEVKAKVDILFKRSEEEVSDPVHH